MMRYIPTTNTAGAQLVAALWRLARPAPGPQDTQGFGSLVTALDGTVWLAVDTSEGVMVHAEAEMDGIADILQPWIDGGHLPSETNAVLAALIESKRGQHLLIYEAFPQLFKDMSKTLEQMVSLNLLPGGVP